MCIDHIYRFMGIVTCITLSLYYLGKLTSVFLYIYLPFSFALPSFLPVNCLRIRQLLSRAVAEAPVQRDVTASALRKGPNNRRTTIGGERDRNPKQSSSHLESFMEGRNDPERQTGRQKGTRQRRSDSAKSAIDDSSSEIVQTPLPSSPLSFTTCVGCQRQLLYPKHFPSSYRRFCLFVCHFLNLIND